MTGSSELVTWMEYFSREQKERDRGEWYHAQTAHLLYAILRILTLGKLPPREKIEAFLLDFTTVPPQEKLQQSATKPKTVGKVGQKWDEERMNLSKLAWFAAVGLPVEPVPHN